MRIFVFMLLMALGATTTLANDLSVVIINGRSMAPLRYVSETFGASISYNSRTKDISLSLDYQKVDMTVGRSNACVGGKTVVLDSAPVIIAGVTYVPVRFISVAFGADCSYEPETRRVKIIHPGSGKKVIMMVKDGPGTPERTVIHKGAHPGSGDKDDDRGERKRRGNGKGRR